MQYGSGRTALDFRHRRAAGSVIPHARHIPQTLPRRYNGQRSTPT